MKPTIEGGPASARVAARATDLRRRQGWSTTVLAQRMTAAGRPHTVSSLGRLERGERRIDVDDLIALAAVLDVPVPSLLDCGPDDDPAHRGLVEGLPGVWWDRSRYLLLIGLTGGQATDGGLQGAEGRIVQAIVEQLQIEVRSTVGRELDAVMALLAGGDLPGEGE